MSTSKRNDQPSLFPAERSVADRFRLDDATRRRGMRHVAVLRAHLEARYPAKPAARSPNRSSRTAA
jgi:hypothetical protein